MKTTRPVLRLSFLSLALVSLVAFTHPPAPSKYKVDTKTSSLLWTGKKVTGQHNGVIGIASGELVAEGATVKEGSFKIDVNSITVTGIADKDSNAKLVGHLKNEDFFDASKYPTANFVITSVTPVSGDQYTVKGNLTIKGKTNEIVFPATIVTAGKTITATAKIIVDRAKFDIRYGSKSFFENIGDKAISDEFELDLKLTAVQS